MRALYSARPFFQLLGRSGFVVRRRWLSEGGALPALPAPARYRWFRPSMDQRARAGQHEPARDYHVRTDVFVVEDYDDPIDADPETVNRLLGYEESFWPQGFWRVADDRPAERVVRRFEI